MNVHFFVSGNLNTVLDPFVYAQRIINGLREKGHNVHIYQLADDFPFPSDESIQEYVKLVQSVPESESLVFDARIFASTPFVLKDISQYNPVIAVVHVPLCVDPQFSAYQRTMITSLEKESYSFVSSFAVPSDYAARQVINLGVASDKIRVIKPGVENRSYRTFYPEAPSSLLSIAALSRNRDHSVLVRALSPLRNKNWVLNCYSNFSHDPAYTQHFLETIGRNGLKDRIFLHEIKSPAGLKEAYANADLFIHPSDFEAYGMSLAEALANGIPVVASTGGGIPETVPSGMGYFYRPGDVYGLESLLEELFENPYIYRKICTNASEYYKTAQNWQNSIDAFEELITGIGDN